MQGAFLNIQVLLVGMLIVMTVMRYRHMHLTTSLFGESALRFMQAFPRSVRIFSLSGALRVPCSCFPMLQLQSDRGTWHKLFRCQMCVRIMITEVLASELGAPSVHDLLSSGGEVPSAVASCL